MTTNFSRLTDDELDRETRRVALIERETTVDLLRLLIEVERRGVHLALGYSSLFTYCTRALSLSEQAAYSRITAARAAKRQPRLLEMLVEGALTLSSVGILAPHLTEETADALMDAARFKSTRDVERLIASAFPQPAIETSIRALPSPSCAHHAAAEPPLKCLNSARAELKGLCPRGKRAIEQGPDRAGSAKAAPCRRARTERDGGARDETQWGIVRQKGVTNGVDVTTHVAFDATTGILANK